MQPEAPDSSTPLDDVDAWAEQALAELGALPEVLRVAVGLVEGAGRRLLFTASDRLGEPVDRWCQVDGFAQVPLNDVVRTGVPVAGPLAALDARYAAFVAAQRGTGFTDLAVVPLADDGQVLGGLVLYFSAHQPFDDAQLDALRRTSDRFAARLRGLLSRPDALPIATTAHGGALVAEHVVRADPASVGEARRVLRRTLAAWDVAESDASRAELCLSELVTNALIHTSGGCRVRLELADRRLTARVLDNGAAVAPRMPPRGETLEGHGYGLRLVEAVSSSWGRSADGEDASTWFTLDLA